MNKANSHGVYVVEFAIVGLLLFVLLFGILEAGRLMFTVNALNESVRRGARLAAVCNIDDSHILKTAMFAGEDGSTSAIFGDIRGLDVDLNYLDEDGAPIDGVNTNSGFSRIRFVEVTISGFQMNLLIPLPIIRDAITLQPFRAILPRESLGRDTEATEPRSC